MVFLAIATGTGAQENTTPNHLKGETSLYLQQHLYNAVDWYPWGPAALEKAQTEGKLIFVSVGYSSCHWCHVMREESFENVDVGEYLNQHFVSIKIDREERPDLDTQFSVTTAFITGTSGWPNSVFLTPEGDPFFAGGYFPREDFLGLAGMIVDLWDENAPAVRAEAFNVASRVQGFLDQEVAVGEVSQEDLLSVAKGMSDSFDEFMGGFGVAPKFPRENVHLFLLDQATRYGDSELLNMVRQTLDAMIAGGIYDQIGGGFHRYAIDPDWNVPHFEKMLYNQALIGRVLVRAYAITGNADYARVAGETFDYVLREMTAPGAGFYAAQDAVSIGDDGKSHEGAYYLWTQEQMVTALSGFSDADIAAIIKVTGLDSIAGAFEVPFEMSDVVLRREGTLSNAQAGRMFEVLRKVRAKRAAPITDRKIIMSWNAIMIATLVEAAEVLDRPELADAAERSALFIWDNMQNEQGFMRLSIDGVAGTQAQLTDLADYGMALVALADAGEFGAGWLDKAQYVRAQMIDGFYDAGSAMRMTRTRQGISIFRPLDDEATPSGNASALAFFSSLDNRLGLFGEETNALAGALAMDATMEPMQRGAMLLAVAEFKGRQSGVTRRSTGGVVKVRASLNKMRDGVDFSMQVKDGWHINAHVPLEDYFIPTSVSVDGVAMDAAQYPAAAVKSLGFNPKPLALYDGGVDLSVPFGPSSSGPVKVVLEIQACSDEVCLQPDEMVFHFWPLQG